MWWCTLLIPSPLSLNTCLISDFHPTLQGQNLTGKPQASFTGSLVKNNYKNNFKNYNWGWRDDSVVKSTLFLQRKNLVPSHHTTPTPSISVYAQVTPAAENSMFFTHAILILTHIHKLKIRIILYFLEIQLLYLKLHGSLTKTYRWYSAVLSHAFKTQLALICSRQKPNQTAISFAWCLL